MASEGLEEMKRIDDIYLGIDVGAFRSDGGFRCANHGRGNNRLRLGLRGQRRFVEGVSLLGGYEYERRSSERYEQFDAASGIGSSPTRSEHFLTSCR